MKDLPHQLPMQPRPARELGGLPPASVELGLNETSVFVHAFYPS